MSVSLKEIKIHEEEKEESINVEEHKQHRHHPHHSSRHVHHSYSPHPYNFREPNTPKNHWNVGCFYLDKDCLVYFTQMFILFGCIGVALWKIATTTENRDIWVSLLSSCIGIIVPNPKLKNEPSDSSH